MNIKQIYIRANKKIPISNNLIQDTQEKIDGQFKGYRIRRRVPRYAIVAVCALLVLALIIPNISKIYNPNNTIIHGNDAGAGNSRYGLDMLLYYRCNGSYYFLQYKIIPELQNNISKRIYGEFYEINGIAPSKSIALFRNDYYWQLDYVYKDTITFMGKPYLIDANSTNREVKDLNYLGYSDQHNIYKVPESDISSKIYVQINNWFYTDYVYAYQYPSTVDLSGITYELSIYRNMIIDNKVEGDYIGMAGQYKAYRNNDPNKGTQETNTIFIHINDTEEVRANAISLLDNSPIPVSRYGTEAESMPPLVSTIHWKNHGFYVIGEILPASAKDQLGKVLDNYSYNGFNYVLYEMEGVDTTKYIIVKNNNVFIKYNYMYTDTIVFNGRTYFIQDTNTNGNYIKGDKIGQSGSINIYEFKGIDPAKQICVPMAGPPLQAGEVSTTLGNGDLIAYSE